MAAVAAALAFAACGNGGDAGAPQKTTTTTGLPTTTTSTGPDTPTIEVTPTSARPGDEVHIRGRGFCPLLAVRVTMRTPEGAPDVPILGNVDADGAGSFELSAVVPDEFDKGPHMVAARHHRVPGRENCLEHSAVAEINLRG